VWFLIPTLNMLKDEKLPDAKARVSKGQAEWDACAFARLEWSHMHGIEVSHVDMESMTRLNGKSSHESYPVVKRVFKAQYRPEFTASEYKLDTLWGALGHPVSVCVRKDIPASYVTTIKEDAEAILVAMISGNMHSWTKWSDLRGEMALNYTDDQEIEMGYSSKAIGGEAAYMCLIRDAFKHMQTGDYSKEVPSMAQIIDVMTRRYSLEKSTVDKLTSLSVKPAAAEEEGETKLFNRVVVDCGIDTDDTDAVEEFVSRMEEECEHVLKERICDFYNQTQDRSFYGFGATLNPPDLSEEAERKNLGDDSFICTGMFFMDIRHFLRTEHKMDIDTPMIPEQRLRELLDERYGTNLNVPQTDDEDEDEDESPKASKRKPTADADEDVVRASKRTRSA